ncbi:UNVERIFIED_CONTAM: hypothetical protein HHA_238170 [Hammondia hammondi]|eukprot:XP_008887558.1 hypothetical protein HHA_238170 [Hammondia hammondi]
MLKTFSSSAASLAAPSKPQQPAEDSSAGVALSRSAPRRPCQGAHLLPVSSSARLSRDLSHPVVSAKPLPHLPSSSLSSSAPPTSPASGDTTHVEVSLAESGCFASQVREGHKGNRQGGETLSLSTETRNRGRGDGEEHDTKESARVSETSMTTANPLVLETSRIASSLPSRSSSSLVPSSSASLSRGLPHPVVDAKRLPHLPSSSSPPPAFPASFYSSLFSSSASSLSSSLSSSSSVCSGASVACGALPGSPLLRSWGQATSEKTKADILEILSSSLADLRDLRRRARGSLDGNRESATHTYPRASADPPACKPLTPEEGREQTVDKPFEGTSEKTFERTVEDNGGSLARETAQERARREEERKGRLRGEILKLCKRMVHAAAPLQAPTATNASERPLPGAAQRHEEEMQVQTEGREEGEEREEEGTPKKSERRASRVDTQAVSLSSRLVLSASLSVPSMKANVLDEPTQASAPLLSRASRDERNANPVQSPRGRVSSSPSTSFLESSAAVAPAAGNGTPSASPVIPTLSETRKPGNVLRNETGETENSNRDSQHTLQTLDPNSVVQETFARPDLTNSPTQLPSSSASFSSSSSACRGVSGVDPSRRDSGPPSNSLSRETGKVSSVAAPASHASSQRANGLSAGSRPPFPALPASCPAAPPADLLRLRETQVASVFRPTQKMNSRSSSASLALQNYTGWLKLPSSTSSSLSDSSSLSHYAFLSRSSCVRRETGEKWGGARESSTGTIVSSSPLSLEEEVYVSRHTLSQACPTELSMLCDRKGDRVRIQAQLLEQIVAGSVPRQVFEHFYGQGVPVEASVSRFLEKRRMQNTTRRVKEHLEKKVPEFFASKGVALGACSPREVFQAAFRYLEQVAIATSRETNGRRRSSLSLPTPVLPSPSSSSSSSSASSFASLHASARGAYLSEAALCEALEVLGWWPKELNACDKKEVLLALALADEEVHGKARLARERLLPQGVTERGWLLGFLTLPYNLPDWPVTLDLLPVDPRCRSALPFLSVSPGTSAAHALRCSPFLLVHAPQDAAGRSTSTCLCGFLHLCRLALLICSAFGEKVGQRFPGLLLRLSERASGGASGTGKPAACRGAATVLEEERRHPETLAAPLDVSAYLPSELVLPASAGREKDRRGRASSREEKKKSRSATDGDSQEEHKATRKKCKVPAWHLCQDMLLSRLVSLEEVQASLELLCPSPWVLAALHLLIGVTSRALSATEWYSLLHPCSPLADPLDLEKISARFDLENPLPSFSSSTSFSSPSFIKNNFLSFFSLASRSSSSSPPSSSSSPSSSSPPSSPPSSAPSCGDVDVCWGCGVKGRGPPTRLKQERDATSTPEKKLSFPPGEKARETQSRLNLHWLSFEKKGSRRGKKGTSFLSAAKTPEDREACSEASAEAPGALSRTLPFFEMLSDEERTVLLNKERVYIQTSRCLANLLADCAASEATQTAVNRLTTAAVSPSVIEPGMPHGGSQALLSLVNAGGSCCFDVYALHACAKVFFAIATKSSLFSLLHDLL